VEVKILPKVAYSAIDAISGLDQGKRKIAEGLGDQAG
jgi:hypothetical protein